MAMLLCRGMSAQDFPLPISRQSAVPYKTEKRGELTALSGGTFAGGAVFPEWFACFKHMLYARQCTRCLHQIHEIIMLQFQQVVLGKRLIDACVTPRKY